MFEEQHGRIREQPQAQVDVFSSQSETAAVAFAKVGTSRKRHGCILPPGVCFVKPIQLTSRSPSSALLPFCWGGFPY